MEKKVPLPKTTFIIVSDRFLITKFESPPLEFGMGMVDLKRLPMKTRTSILQTIY